MHLTVQNLCDDLYSIIVFAPIAHMKRELLEKKFKYNALTCSYSYLSLFGMWMVLNFYDKYDNQMKTLGRYTTQRTAGFL